MGDEPSIDEQQKALQNPLSGLFCARLDGHPAHDLPTRALPPTGDLPRLSASHKHNLRHAMLSAQRVCTEILNPFLKLLPCSCGRRRSA
jgi:hypothetical protein